jgi:hypothetical protein
MRTTMNCSSSSDHHSSIITTNITGGRSTLVHSSCTIGINRSQQCLAALLTRTLRGTAQAA